MNEGIHEGMGINPARLMPNADFLSFVSCRWLVIAVESPQNHDDEGINVLYADGTTNWLEGDAAGRVLEEHGFVRQSGSR